MRPAVFLSAAFLATLAAAPAIANGPYLEPTTFGSNRDYVTILAAHGAEVAFLPMGPIRTLGDFFATSPDGVTSNIGVGQAFKGLSVVEPALAQDGTWRISTGERKGRVSRAVLIDGVWRPIRTPQQSQAPARPAGPPPAADNRPQPIDEKDVPAGAEIAESVGYLRADTYVTRGAPSPGALKPTGQGFELAPHTNPNEVFAGEPFAFSFLNDGKGVAGVEFNIRRAGDVYTETMYALRGRTDAAGAATVNIPGAGRYILEASYPGNGPPGQKPNPKTTSYSLTFEVAK